MNKTIPQTRLWIPVLAAVLLSCWLPAVMPGTPGSTASPATTFNFTAKADLISTADGGNDLIWGYADDDDHDGNGSRAQYPGPTLIVNQGRP